MQTRRRASLFIACYLAVQLALPLHYYTLRSDENDERFAWRMFSPIHLRHCEPRFWTGFAGERKPMALQGAFHEAWINTARRGRLGVTKAMAAKLCRAAGEHHGAEPPLVRVELHCRDVDGSVVTYGEGWNLCLTDRL